MDILVDPQLGTSHYIAVQQRRPLKVHVSAWATGTEYRVQCWTDLPLRGERDNKTWAAVELAPGKGLDGSRHLTAALDIGIDVLFAGADVEAESSRHTGRSAQYRLTWRAVDNHGEIHWLGHGSEDDAVITFVESSGSTGDNVDSSGRAVVSTFHAAGVSALQPIASLREATQGLVIEQTKPTWHTSRAFTRYVEVSECFDATFLIIETLPSECLAPLDGAEAGIVQVFVPICTDGVDVTLRRRGHDLCAHVAKTGNPADVNYGYVVTASGAPSSLHELVKNCFKEASKLQKSVSPRAEGSRMTTGPFDGGHGLGICTWESLRNGRIPLSLSSLKEVISDVEDAALHSVTSLLIDDGWQDIVKQDGSRGQLRSFELGQQIDVGQGNVTNDARLATLVANVKKAFPALQDVGVWMTLAGYWDGLCPDPGKGAFSAQYGPVAKATLRCPLGDGAPREWTWWLPAPEKLYSCYDDYFASLVKVGVTFVKVDDQADWEWIEKLEYGTDDGNRATLPLPAAYARKAWLGMIGAAHKHFGPHGLLHCMALGKRLLNGLAAEFEKSTGGATYVRTSEDTFPDVPAAHIWHLYHNAMEAILAAHGASCIVPDADMITTTMRSECGTIDWAEMHAAFRCVFSSATIWLSDVIDGESGSASRARTLQRILAPRKGNITQGTVQLRRGLVSLPLPGHALLDLTSAKPGPALMMATNATESQSEYKENPRGCILSLWNVRSEGHRAYGAVTLADIAQATQIQGHEVLDTSDDRSILVMWSYLRCTLLWLSQADIDKQRHLAALTSTPVMPYLLDAGQWDVLSIVQAQNSYPDDAPGLVHIACLGLVDKYAGLTAVAKIDEQDASKSAKAKMTCRIDRAGKCAFAILFRSSTPEDELSFDPRSLIISIDAQEVAKDCIDCTKGDIDGRGNSVLVTIDMVRHLNNKVSRLRDNKADVQDDEAWTVCIHVP